MCGPLMSACHHMQVIYLRLSLSHGQPGMMLDMLMLEILNTLSCFNVLFYVQNSYILLVVLLEPTVVFITSANIKQLIFIQCFWSAQNINFYSAFFERASNNLYAVFLERAFRHCLQPSVAPDTNRSVCICRKLYCYHIA